MSCTLQKMNLPPVARHIMLSADNALHSANPFDYWVMHDVLPVDAVDAIAALPFAPPYDAVHDGRRESNNSTRVYFNAENQGRFPVCRDVAMAFSEPACIRVLEKVTGARLGDGFLRIEYCQDTSGFWLEPHLDITVKLFTLIIYLSDSPRLADAGTDIYDASPQHNRVTCVPYRKNLGMMFVPGQNTWHGFSKRPIYGVRKSLIVNYVSPEWRNKDELAYQ